MTGEPSSRRRLLTIGLLVLLALVPLGFEQYKLYVASLTLVYLVMAIGLNLTLGYAGQISLATGRSWRSGPTPWPSSASAGSRSSSGS